MKTVYVIVGEDITVTESTIQELKKAAHGMILGNPDDMLVWRCDSIGAMAFYMTTNRQEAQRLIERESAAEYTARTALGAHGEGE